MIDEGLSCKLKALSFVAMMNVVMIHSVAIGKIENPAPWYIFLNTFCFKAMTSWAVPFFFMVSGYFFSKSTYFKQGGGRYKQLVAKKAQTLLVPYLCWVIIGAIISVPLILLNNYLMHRNLMERMFFADGFGWGSVDRFFGITGFGPLPNFALWYIRTLLVLFVASPFFRLMGRLGGVFCIALGVVCVMFSPTLEIPYISVNLGSVGWFTLGIGVALRSVERHKFHFYVVLLAMALFCCAGIIYATSVAFPNLMHPTFCMVAKRVEPLLGVLSWYGIMSCFNCGALPECMDMTFWVYCFHHAVTGWFLSGSLFMLGKTDSSAVITSLITVTGTLVVTMASGYSVKKMLPRLYYVLVGGRT